MRLATRFLVSSLLLLPLAPLAAQTPDAPKRFDGYARVIPGTPRGDGFTRLGTLTRVSLTEENHVRNAIIIKTRQYHALGKGAVGFHSPEINRVLAKYGVKRIRAPFPQFAPSVLAHADRFGLGRMYEVTVGTEGRVAEIVEKLSECADVEYAEPLFIRKSYASPDDPSYGSQYAMIKVAAEAAWEITKGDTSVTIAITDSGIDWTHEDLASNIWTNPGEIPANNIDDDGNGKVDDIHGWDFVGNVSLGETLFNVYREDNNPKIDSALGPNDSRQHGTHVAGVAGAAVNNGKGIAGIGYGCRLIPVKLGSDAVQGNMFRGYEGILYAATLGADIINCSWGGGGFSQAEQDVIDQVTAMGSLVVAASGNESSNTDNFKHYPSSYRNVLTVGATGTGDHSADFTNYGVTTHVYAPGVDILSTVTGGYQADGWSGTSMASPMVAGIAGLIKSLHPDWEPGRIAQQIRSTVEDVMIEDPQQRPRFYGRVNAYMAVQMNRGGDDPNTVPGIDVVDVSIDATDGIISDTDPKQMKLSLRNYLGAAGKTTVTLRPLDAGATIGTTTFTLDTLASLAETELDLTIQARENKTWFEGSVDILVTITSGDYTDYELLQVPYHFDVPQKYTMVVPVLPGEVVAYAGSSPTPEVLWAVGELPGLGGGFIRMVDGAVNYNFISPTALSTIYAFDATRAVTASGPTIFRTVNGGQSWTNRDLSSITGSVQSIHFFDANRGIALGLPHDGKWGVALTANGGGTWSKIDQAPEAADPFAGFGSSAVSWIGEKGWFGASDGSVYRTTDGGTTWDGRAVVEGESVFITHLAFRDDRTGILIYRGWDALERPRVAISTDGGETWVKDHFDFSTISLIPVHLGVDPAESAFYVMGNDGRIVYSFADGGSWEGIATFKSNAVISSGVTSPSAGSVRMWNIGTSIGYLDFTNDNASTGVDRSGSIVSSLNMLELRPNPTRGDVRLEIGLDLASGVEVTVVNPMGETVARPYVGTLEAGRSSVTIDTRGLPNGTYFCRVATSDGSRTARMTIQR